MKPSKQTIAIVGAGIIGRMLALQLANQKHQVTLFERESEKSQAAVSFTAAGMLTPYSELENCETLIFQLGMRSLQLWPKIIDSLQTDCGYFQRGCIVVAHPGDHADLLRFKQQASRDFCQTLNNENVVQTTLTKDDLAKLEPELWAKFSSGYYFSKEAWLSAHKTMAAILAQLKTLGVKTRFNCAVQQIESQKIYYDKQSQTFDWVIDCRGLAAKETIQNLRGVRGELILLDAPEVKLSRLVRLIHPRYQLYVVPQSSPNQYIIGATQIESDDLRPISVRSTLELLSAAYSIHSGFAEAAILNTKSHCRPAMPNNLPLVHINDKLIQVNGLFRHGYLVAPAIAEQIVQVVAEDSSWQGDLLNSKPMMNA
ncbi:glycine oxidase ThiO [Aliikangiella sp. IMCC44653]